MLDRACGWMNPSITPAIHGNDIQDNSSHGLSLELSAKVGVVNNVIAGNDGHGLKVNNTSEVQIWNNTFSANGRAVNIVQDGRRASNPDVPGHDPRQTFPDPTMSWINGPVEIRNNIFANPTPGTDCLLCVEDYSGTFSAEQLKVTALGDAYHRGRRARLPSFGPWMPAGPPCLLQWANSPRLRARRSNTCTLRAWTRCSTAIVPPHPLVPEPPSHSPYPRR